MWRPISKIDLPVKLAPFLSERGSLTQKLATAVGQTCQLEIVSERWQQAWQDEMDCLQLIDQPCWVREVVLSFGQSCVFARSVFPKALIESDERFAALGDKPLGQVLFEEGLAKRGDIYVAEINEQSDLFQKATSATASQAKTLWARRSMFTINQHQLFVTEVMLPYVATI